MTRRGIVATGLLCAALAGAGLLAWPRPSAPEEPSSPAGPPRFTETFDAKAFLRGNLHAHTLESDGDSPPEEVAAWYRDHGYAFLTITDHNERLDPLDLDDVRRSGFVLIPGEEVTMTSQGKPVHVNALCHRTAVGGGDFPTARDALRSAVRAILRQGGVALVNHPNFGWALTAADLRSASGAALLEVWSGHPYVHSAGDALRPSHEALWDATLSSGMTFAGAAVDDVHHLEASPDERDKAGPGRAWVEVYGAEASAASICDALARGRLYFSSGVKLRRLALTDTTLSVWPEATDALVEFIADGGAVIQTTILRKSEPAVHKLGAAQRYVRARVTRPDGRRAWTQAYRVAR